MEKEQIKITFIGMDSSDAMRDYVLEKLSKFQNLLDKVISLEVVFTENVHNRGVATDFTIEINASVPKTGIYVQEIGENMYALIDTATDVLERRLNRYFDKTNQWEGKEPWKFIEAEAQFDGMEADEEEGAINNYSNYKPKIVSRRKLSDMRPMEEAEAVESMELSGMKQILFKSNSTGNYSMIYKIDSGGYVLVEPDEDLG